MIETWRCHSCGEDVSDSYVECWNCQAARPGYSTPSEQVKRWEEQVAETERQNKIADELQAEHLRQSRMSAEMLEVEKHNQQRLSALLDRWEIITDLIEVLKKP